METDPILALEMEVDEGASNGPSPKPIALEVIKLPTDNISYSTSKHGVVSNIYHGYVTG